MGQMAVIVTNPATDETIAELDTAWGRGDRRRSGARESCPQGLARRGSDRPRTAPAPAHNVHRGAHRRARPHRIAERRQAEPWNFPLNISSWKLGPALACGNTVVLKPAELTSLSALRLEELILEAGIPKGVVNVAVGPGRVVGQRLVEHPDVAKIGFTGSTEVGRGVMQGAAGTIKRVTLELGGKSASVVFADVDLEQAAAAAPYAVFDNAGQRLLRPLTHSCPEIGVRPISGLTDRSHPNGEGR
jgi:hypothetical protein